MTNYEVMLMLFPDLGEKKTAEALAEVKELFTSFGAEFTNEDVWGVRELAYRIKKQDQGYYVVWNMKFAGQHLAEVETALNINQNVMRYLVVKTPVNYDYVSLDTYDEIAQKEEEEAAKERAEKEAERKPEKKRAPRTTTKKPSEDKLKKIVEDPDISL